MAEETYTYRAKTWKNYPDTSTPLNAKNIQDMDDGIEKAHERLDQLEANSSYVTITGEPPLQQNLMMYSGQGYDIEDSGINYRDVVTKTDLNNWATVIDYGDTKFTLTNTEIFTMIHQHIYQIGSLVFVHLVFQTKKTLTDSMLYELGQLDIAPMHTHSFTVVPANPGVSKDMRVDPGYISIDGKVSLDVTESYSSKNYTFDITTFYCTDMTVDTPTE